MLTVTAEIVAKMGIASELPLWLLLAMMLLGMFHAAVVHVPVQEACRACAWC